MRQKLKLAGLPEDIITTVRGQGYCLKPLPQNNDIDLSQDNSRITPISSVSTEQQPDKRSQHLAALTSIWEKYQPKREQQLVALGQAIESFRVGNLETSDRVSAIVIAHSLAGNLGQFGLE